MINTLTKIKNGLDREYERVKIPYSKLNMTLVETLVKSGFLESAVKKGRGIKKIIDIRLKYNAGDPAISGIKFLSKPSKKTYIGYKDIKKSHKGMGHYVLSTSHGIMTETDAKKNKVGGELLFEIW
ncbi:MAG: 30S ribosomal protein S8 [Candidatus Colwellbacteria bacterium]|nr:30S ribosomal protein S8 [Candidatus Colwellbacteria bacterium]